VNRCRFGAAVRDGDSTRTSPLDTRLTNISAAAVVENAGVTSSYSGSSCRAAGSLDEAGVRVFRLRVL
jgi:hypothetical protein